MGFTITLPVMVNFQGGVHDAFPSTFATTRAWTYRGVYDNVLVNVPLFFIP
jgi:hypothetical protein